MPFDEHSSNGYVLAIFMEYLFAISILAILKCFLIFGIGTCSMLFPMAKDIKYNLQSVSDNVKRKGYRSKVGREFTHFVQFHCELIQLSLALSQPQNTFSSSTLIFPHYFRLFKMYLDFSRIIFVILFTWSIAGISSIMLLLKMKMVKQLHSFIQPINQTLNNDNDFP